VDRQSSAAGGPTHYCLAILILPQGLFVARTAVDIVSHQIPVSQRSGTTPVCTARHGKSQIVLATERTAQSTVNDLAHTAPHPSTVSSSVVTTSSSPTPIRFVYPQIPGVSQTAHAPVPPEDDPRFSPGLRCIAEPIIQPLVAPIFFRKPSIFERLPTTPSSRSWPQFPGLRFPYPLRGSSGRCRVTCTHRRCARRDYRVNVVAAIAGSRNLIIPAERRRSATSILRQHERYPAEGRGDEMASRSPHPNGQRRFVLDVAHVRDWCSSPDQHRSNEGKRAALMTI